MKPHKQVSNLMDVSLSPIVNKSVLQSSNDSALTDTISKEKDDNSDIRLKTLPAFTTIQETYYEKSVLRSYNSSVGESSQEVEKITETVATSNTVANLKPLPTLSSLNDIELNNSILKSYESTFGESSKEDSRNKVQPYAALAKMTHTDFERSVLRSFANSLEKFHEVTENDPSLISNDSDVDMERGQSESQDAAAVIQKEKEQIVEIEREINEIEGDMSDDENSGGINEETSEEEAVEEEEEEETESSGTSDEVSKIA